MLPSPNNCFLKKVSPEDLEKLVESLRAQGKKIVTLNGSFDLMHAGHLEIIHQASLQGDVLIVGLNTDRSIQEYKCKTKPIVPLEYRLQLISALGFVDYVTWFDEPDPLLFLSKIKPDVHTNGAEYGENCIEAALVKANGGRIYVVDLVPGLSTSRILEKIKSL